MPQDGLDRAQIVRAAIAQLDEEGVEGLSMRRLGTRLGAGATSLYWHVGGRDALLALVADAVVGEIELPDPERVPWREALAAGAVGLRDVMVRHPWLLGVFGAVPDLHGPEIARFQHHMVVSCEVAGFAEADQISAGDAVFAYVLGASWGEGRDDSISEEALARARANAAAYPRLLARFDALAQTDPRQVREESFAFGLAAVLDGLATRLGSPAGEPIGHPGVHVAPDGTVVVDVPPGTPVLVRTDEFRARRESDRA